MFPSFGPEGIQQGQKKSAIPNTPTPPLQGRLKGLEVERVVQGAHSLGGTLPIEDEQGSRSQSGIPGCEVAVSKRQRHTHQTQLVVQTFKGWAKISRHGIRRAVLKPEPYIGHASPHRTLHKRFLHPKGLKKLRAEPQVHR